MAKPIPRQDYAVLVDGPIRLEELLVETERFDTGAVAVFLGTVRNFNGGRRVVRMRYEAHEEIADRVLRDIECEALRNGALACRIQHRVGMLELGEVSVAIVVRAAHRERAFAACRQAIEAIKRRVPIWKEEFFADGTSEFVEGVPLETKPLSEPCEEDTPT